MEKVVCASDFDWTIVRPPHLKNGIAANGYKTKAGGLPRNGWSGLQFTDLAACLLDVVEGGKYIRQIVGVASA
jgi:putative NADH-flavin reductase